MQNFLYTTLAILVIAGIVSIWFGAIGFWITVALCIFGQFSGSGGGLGASFKSGVDTANKFDRWTSGKDKMITKRCRSCNWSATKSKYEWGYSKDCPNCFGKRTLTEI
tara:strand:+ start:203 stop:526 length:324 start_codon:yes stop_codon:yes gene_type:complete